MIETTIYKCEYCGAELDDEYEANCHEWVYRYDDVKKRDGSALGFYQEDGTEMKITNPHSIETVLDCAMAFTVGNISDAEFVIGIFKYFRAENPFNDFIVDNDDKTLADATGLWYYTLEAYAPEWVRVDDQIKKWVDTKNKFVKGA